jgi:hypothetical protein
MSGADLESARREFAARLDSLRETMRRKSGLQLRRSGWWVLLLSGAVGMALAGRKRRRPKRGERD